MEPLAAIASASDCTPMSDMPQPATPKVEMVVFVQRQLAMSAMPFSPILQ